MLYYAPAVCALRYDDVTGDPAWRDRLDRIPEAAAALADLGFTLAGEVAARGDVDLRDVFTGRDRAFGERFHRGQAVEVWAASDGSSFAVPSTWVDGPTPVRTPRTPGWRTRWARPRSCCGCPGTASSSGSGSR
jgi:hypothetical protein